jgi:dolichyl-diphosphooligosaccharide--protein glycosyltransferase
LTVPGDRGRYLPLRPLHARKGPALAAALLLAISNAHISRTHYGWFDDEALSIPLMHAGFLLYLLAINKNKLT